MNGYSLEQKWQILSFPWPEASWKPGRKDTHIEGKKNKHGPKISTCRPCSDKTVNIKEIKKKKPGVENTIFRYQICLITLSEYMSNRCELLKVGHWFATLGTDTALLPAKAEHVT